MFTEILTTAIAAMPALSQQGVPQNPQQANIDQAVQVLLNMAQASAQPGADGSCVIKLEGPEAIQAMQRLSAALNDSQPRTQGRPAPRQAGPRTMPMRHVVPAQQCQPAQRMGGQRAPQGQLKGSCSMRPAQVTIATEQKPMMGMRKAGFHHNQNGQCRKAAWLSAASRQGKMMRHHHMQSGQKPMMGMRKAGFHHNQNGQCRKAAWLSAASRQGKMMRHHHMQSGQKPMMGMRKGGFHHNQNGQCRKAAWLCGPSRQGQMMRHHHMQSGQKPMMGMRKGGFHHNQNGQCRKAAWLCGPSRQGQMMRHHHMQSGQKPMMGMRKGGFHHNQNGQCRKAAWLSAASRQGKMMRHHHMQSGQKPMMGMRKGGFHHNRKAGMAPFQAAAMAPAPFCNMQKTFRGAPAAKQAPTINVFIINVNVAPQQGNKPCFGPNVGRPNCVSGNGMTPEAAAALQQIMPVLMNLGNCR